MAPLTPTWHQPSHPAIQSVVKATNPDEFMTKSFSKVELKPFALFAKMDFPPCTVAEDKSYATVQFGKEKHLSLNSDLVYINHGCEPSLIFDTSSLTIIAGANGLKVGEELTFFYPSTEWDMDQAFECECGAATCRGIISGAKNMTETQLEGIFLNAHIRELLETKNGGLKKQNGTGNSNGTTSISSKPGFLTNSPVSKSTDATEEALKASLTQAKKMVESAQKALDIYNSLHGEHSVRNGARSGVGARELAGEMGGDTRRGVTSRELSGEMGGDTQIETEGGNAF